MLARQPLCREAKSFGSTIGLKMMPLTTRRMAARRFRRKPKLAETPRKRHACAELAQDFRTETSSPTEDRSMVGADAEVVANCAL
jgi:hypothetical protein